MYDGDSQRGEDLHSRAARTPRSALNDVERKYGPPKLYLASNEKVPLPSPQSAIVGSRRASPERMRTAGEIVEILVRKGVIVVSGLAEGIDAAAHKASIEGGG